MAPEVERMALEVAPLRKKWLGRAASGGHGASPPGLESNGLGFLFLPTRAAKPCVCSRYETKHFLLSFAALSLGDLTTGDADWLFDLF
jgi:hypothetical protein